MWKKLRDSHRQALNKKKTTTGQAASNDKVWKYEKQMGFLLPHLTNRQRSTNASVTQDFMQTDADEILTFENTQTEEVSELTTTNNESQVTTYNIPQNKRKNDKITEYLEKEQKRREKRSTERDFFRKELLSREKEPKEDTALKKFFESMCGLTNDLPEYLQIKVQRQVFNSVMEARETNLQKQSETKTYRDQLRPYYVSVPHSSDSSRSGITDYEFHISSPLPSTSLKLQDRTSSLNNQCLEFNDVVSTKVT